MQVLAGDKIFVHSTCNSDTRMKSSPGSVKLLSLYTRPPGTSTSNLSLERKLLFSSQMDKLNHDMHELI
jgi:hypothetical protein